MALSRTMERATVVIPAQGMIEFRDNLTDLLEEFGTDDLSGQPRSKTPAVTHYRRHVECVFYF